MTEAQIQKSVFDNFKTRGMPGVVAWHCPNGPEARRKSGYLAGVSDVNALHKGKFFALELKKLGGLASQEQLEYVAAINTAGGFAFVAYGLDKALEFLESWGLLRKAA